MEDDEEFFDAFETIEQLSHSILEDFDTEPRRSFSIQPKRESVTQVIEDLSEFKTALSLPPHKTELFSWTTLNLVKKAGKDIKEFSGLEIVQELKIASSKNWVLKFSPDSKFLLVAGEKPVIQLFRMSARVTEKALGLFCHEGDYVGHEQSVVSVDWDANSEYFLSCGIDCLVLLWRVGVSIPTRQFLHDHIVSCVGFSPKLNSLFFTGSLSKRITFWSLPEGTIENTYQVQGLITAAKFSPDGSTLALGLSNGECILYEVHNSVLTYLTQLHCKNRKGFKSSGKKVTSIDFQDDQYILICTNDSRIRLFSLTDFRLLQKYKSGKCEQYPLKATFSHNSIHVIRGSEDGSVHIWNTFKAERTKKWKLIKNDCKNSSYEYFKLGKEKSCSNAVFGTSDLVKKIQNELVADGSEVIVSHILVVAYNEKLSVLYNQFKNVSC